MTSIARRIALIAAGAILGGLITASSQPDVTAQASTAVPISVLTLNTSGARINASEVPKFAKRQATRVLRYKADVAAFQEITDPQTIALRALLEPQGYRVWYTLMDPAKGTGLALAVKAKAVAGKRTLWLPQPVEDKYGKRRMLCLDGVVFSGLPTTVCTTHSSPTDPNREVQAEWLREQMAGIKGAKILLGDLNLAAEKPALQAFKAEFPDPDMTYPRAGATVVNYLGIPKKFDHTFWSGNMTDRKTMAYTDSDHKAVWACGVLTDGREVRHT